MNIPVIVLFGVFGAIAFRQVSRIRLQIWQIMLCGALAVLLTGSITPEAALRAIDLDIMVFLFWMFLAGRALETSGYLAHLAYSLFSRAKNADMLLFFIVFGCGLLSAFLMNDTVAIVGTPLMLMLARQHRMHTRPLLLALAFAVTTGSVMSPIGNPQNLLIAVKGLPSDAFAIFGRYLLLPTLVSLAATHFMLKSLFREHFGEKGLVHQRDPLRDTRMAAVSRFSLISAMFVTGLKILLTVVPGGYSIPITWIAAAAGIPVLLFSPRRTGLLRTLDWPTLVFFAAMFVLMNSVWESGFFQGVFSSSGVDLTHIPSLMTVSILLSQLISNVPLVALCLPALTGAGASTKLLMALAAGSTIAGNLFIFGAASNVIIVQSAESRGDKGISFTDFARVGIPLTIVQAFIYGVAFALMP
jgi:Na+/H+ antiporter NhaD/arsenite permease-like protein